MSQKERFKKRNQAVRNEFNKLVREQPKWRIDAIIDDVADKFFIASRTAEAIIKSEGIYKEN
ncbi:hypothetical protein [Flavobacterium sp. N1994]|uniref:hypothetical protein n=1 Tax=Flavobacterium sp. N1994 TaxID=2986827 RepID=UPI00222329F9|nr:hypothetical protein [Flavobacterium sp. N1994]